MWNTMYSMLEQNEVDMAQLIPTALGETSKQVLCNAVDIFCQTNQSIVYL